jgi:ArsR family transcriptional regulator
LHKYTKGGNRIKNKAVLIFKALSCEKRIEILKILSNERLCLCELADRFDIDVSTISRHISELVRVGVLNEKKEGTRKFFSIAQPDILKIVEIAEKIGGK